MTAIYPFLTFAGAIPFIGFAAFLHLDIDLPWIGPSDQALSLYGAIIASFMAGSQWGMHLPLKCKQSQLLALFTNAIAIAVWLGFLMLSPPTYWFLLILTFTSLLMVDRRLKTADIITPHYFKTRIKISIIVVLSLLIAVVS